MSLKSVAILETAVAGKKSISAHNRNSDKLARKFPFITLFVTREDYKKNWGRKFDKIFVMYATHYLDHQPIVDLINANPQAKLYWITNEYNIALNGSLYKIFKQRGYTQVANFVESGATTRKYQGFESVNMNALLFDERKDREKQAELVYYGTFRTGRAKYFVKYFKGKGIHVSTSRKNIGKFKGLGCEAHYIKPFVWGANPTLSLFRYSLYVEDEFTHSHYNYPANRFYEALSCGVVQFFDVSCKNTFKIYGLEIPEFYFVDSYQELMQKIKEANASYDLHLKFQQSWRERAKNDRDEFYERIRQISQS